ncbi:isocitrate lyase/phosphoenolpyruvate mutase family protein [Salmonella enterica]|nr:isocitrate lyase/phosphoenolpyruvate mutase family protein [Salmonella enterica]ELX2845041.1 isocitrate lyase/phosphoenolpyruvate mutase family protein [Salmonella enterica]
MNKDTFKNLHSKNSFFVLGNCWDAISARVYEQAGYKAVGTSSWALSSINGVKDGENITFNTVIKNVQDILKQIKIPLSVDLEKGYSQKKDVIIKNVLTLAHIGCSGINIEDSDNQGELISPQKFANTIESIKSALLAAGFSDFVINARTDTYLNSSLMDKIKETLTRASIYEAAGADCLFVPGVSDLNEISKISSSIKLPLNVLNLPDIANTEKLRMAGVNRFSLGNSVFDDMLAYIERTVAQTSDNGDYANHYNHSPLRLSFN